MRLSRASYRHPLILIALLIILLGWRSLPYFKTSPPSETTLPRYRNASPLLNHATWSSFLDTRFSSGVCVLDANGDGLDDIFIPGLGDFNVDSSILKNPRIGNALFLNRADEKGRNLSFQDVTDDAGVRGKGHLGIGCAAADYDNDGRIDIVVTNGTKGVNASVYGMVPSEERDRRIFPPFFARTDKTNGAYRFPREGGVTLFHNEGNGTNGIPQFRNATQEAGLLRGGNSTAVAFGDVDNDGFVDLFVANYLDPDFMAYRTPYMGGSYNVLYRNKGNGTFLDVTTSAGVAGEPEYVYDANGNKLYGWNKDEKDAVGKSAGDPAGNTLAALFIDYNHDGLLDLLTADDLPGRIRLYENKGNFNFAQVSEKNEMGVAGAWMGIAGGDINNDGYEDIFATNFGGETGSRYRPTSDIVALFDIFNPPNKGTYYNSVWLGGAEGFRNVTNQTEVDWGEWLPDIRWYPPRALQAETIISPEPKGIEKGGFGFGTVIFDFDNDGVEDIAWIGNLIRAGLPYNDLYGNPGRLLRNLGDGMRFKDVAKEVGASNVTNPDDSFSYQNGRGLAIGDFDNNGYPDIVMTNAGGFDSKDADVPTLPEMGFDKLYFYIHKEYRPGPTFLYLSEGGRNHWLKVRLVGKTSNRSGIGAKVTVEYDENRTLKRISRTIRAGSGYASQNSLTALFGLGSQKAIRSITVLWPSGKTQTIANPSVDTLITITEQ